jgi:hypothetical protein
LLWLLICHFFFFLNSINFVVSLVLDDLIGWVQYWNLARYCLRLAEVFQLITSGRVDAWASAIDLALS